MDTYVVWETMKRLAAKPFKLVNSLLVGSKFIKLFEKYYVPVGIVILVLLFGVWPVVRYGILKI